jgi:hypothetical protein
LAPTRGAPTGGALSRVAMRARREARNTSIPDAGSPPARAGVLPGGVLDMMFMVCF